MVYHTLVLGGTSDICRQICRAWAPGGDSFVLVARDTEALARATADLKARGAAEAIAHIHDLTEVDPARLDAWAEDIGGFDRIVIGYGSLGDQALAERSDPDLAALLEVNFTSAARWLQASHNYLASGNGGSLLVIGSVAGDRARKPNFAYGAAKAALQFYAEGLQLKATESGVHVTILKPGLTDTKMTDGMDKSGPLWSSPQVVAETAARALGARRRIAYAPWFWRVIMFVIRSIPQPIFRKLNF